MALCCLLDEEMIPDATVTMVETTIGFNLTKQLCFELRDFASCAQYGVRIDDNYANEDEEHRSNDTPLHERERWLRSFTRRDLAWRNVKRETQRVSKVWAYAKSDNLSESPTKPICEQVTV